MVNGITVEKEVDKSKLSSKIIVVDVGDRNIATKVELNDGKFME
jgi:type II secretory pathway component GspD/PulD (secretin)